MRIGIVNDQAMAVEAIRRVLTKAPQHRVTWVARDGAEAVGRCAEDKPDLILMDLLMPVMDGVEATRRIMTATPCAILVVTATVEGNAAKVFDAMGAGALDAINTPAIPPSGTSNSAAALLFKIESIAKLIGDPMDPQLASARSGATSFFSRRNRLVALGASAGGPTALATLLAGLPGNFPAAIVVVQHVDEQFVAGLAEWLAQHTELRVGLAREGEEPALGAVLIAGTSDHLALSRSNRLTYTPEPRDYPYRPSVDVFFESVAKHWRGDVVAVLLTGMGRDGAKGLKTLRNRGHYTIAQDQATSAVYGMPKAAAALDAAVDILPLERIAPTLTGLFAANLKHPIQP
jgi:chemotaxis response regulator CheB